MIKDKYRRNWEWGVTAFLVICGCIAAYFLFQRWDGVARIIRRLLSILEPIFIGFALAFILDSLVKTITSLLQKLPLGRKKDPERTWKGYRVIAIILSEIVFVAVVTVLLISVIPQFGKSLGTLINNLPSYVASIKKLLMPLLEQFPDALQPISDAMDNIGVHVRTFLQNEMINLLPSVTNTAIQVGSSVYNVGLGIIVSVYLLGAKMRLIGRGKKLLYALVRVDRANRLLDAGRFTARTFKRFFVGKLLDSFIIGILCFIGITVMGMPYTILIAIVVGVTNVIPYFGPFIGAIPSALLILAVDPQKCLIFVIFILILQQIDGNYIGPKVLGNTTGVTSLGVMLSILVGGGLFGIMGMLMSVPAYAVIYSFVKRAAEKLLRKKDLPEATATYLQLDRVDEQNHPVALPGMPPKAPRKKRPAK